MLDDANELADFHSIQRYLKDPFDPDRARRPGTVLVLPSMTMEPAGLAKIPGVGHYEERLLCMLQLLRDPLTRIVYVTSEPGFYPINTRIEARFRFIKSGVEARFCFIKSSILPGLHVLNESKHRHYGWLRVFIILVRLFLVTC